MVWHGPRRWAGWLGKGDKHRSIRYINFSPSRFRCTTDCEEYPEHCISERLFREMADMMVVDGWLDAGYTFLMMDDCWPSKNRSADGRLEADPDRFPAGIKSLADYVHKLGLKFGIYEDFGVKTCAGYPGSQGHLQTDAQTFADWGVDYVKMDGCNSDPRDMDLGFPQFGAALNATGRPMVYQCEWPLYQAAHGITPNYTAIRQTCNLWRNFYDVQDNWNSVQGIVEYYGNNEDGFLEIAGPGGWNDPDMLVIGNFGLSYEQSKAQMSLWAVLAAPLIMSNDLRDIRPEMKALLQHREVIGVSQDPLGLPGRRVGRTRFLDFFLRPVVPVYRGRTSQAVVVFNRRQDGGVPRLVRLSPRLLGLEGGVYRVTDLWSGEDLGLLGPDHQVRLLVPPMGVRMLRYSTTGVSRSNGSHFRFNLVKIITEDWQTEEQ